MKNFLQNLIAKSSSPLAEEGFLDLETVKNAVIHNDQKSRDKVAQAHKTALKGSVAGAAMVGGYINPYGLLGDLGITTASTLTDMAIDGNTSNVGKDFAINVASDIIGHGVGKAISKIVKDIKPSSIKDVIDYIKNPYNKKLNTDNLLELINNASLEDLNKLHSLLPYHEGEMGLVRPLIEAKQGRLHGFHVSLTDAMQKMRHSNTPDSKFIQDATNALSEAWNHYLKSGGNNGLSIRNLPTEAIPAKKYVSHGISVSNFNKAVQKEGNSIMPSLAILPQDTDNPWKGILFIGNEELLKGAKIYSEDAWTPTISMVKDYPSKTDSQILNEMLQLDNIRSTPEISLQDVKNTQWLRSLPTKEVRDQNSFTKWFFSNISTNAVPGSTPYMEAKYQGLLPFSSFSHALIPEDATEAISWVQKNNIPYSTYSDFNYGDRMRRYEALQKILEDSDLLFKTGGKIDPEK